MSSLRKARLAWGAAGVLLAALPMARADEIPTAWTEQVSQPAPAPAKASYRADPFEPWNRAVFSFNESVDEALLKPVARGYRQVVPPLVRQGVRNVIGNVEDAWSAANHLLQGKPEESVQMMVRVVANTTIGLGGLFDVAADMGLERRSEDFGQTLGRWGVPAGPYLMLPLMGPRTVRDALAIPVDRRASIAQALEDDQRRAWAVTAIEVVQARSELLAAGDLLGQVALDRYTFVRDAYLARRRSLVHDGNPPREDQND